MAGKHTEYHSYNIEEIENEKPKPKTPKYKNYDSDFYEELMSTPIYGSKEEWKDDYEGGDYEPEDSFSWNYYFNDDGE